MVLSKRPDVENGSEKFRMAAANYTCISASIQDSREIPTTACMFSGSGNTTAISRRLHLETGSQQFKMESVKPEAPISQLLYKIAEKFQRSPVCFRSQGIQWC
jgi:hypothetical protein